MGSGYDRKPGAGPFAPNNYDRTTASAPGKRTLVEQLTPVQRVASSTEAQRADGEAVQQAAAQGVAGTGGSLPYGDAIQRLFGRHDIGGVEAHVGGPAATASRAIGAEAYAMGSKVAFASSPDLHTAAHEAAHVIQQRGGVQLKGGVGESGDVHEQHANAVADKVVQGQSAEALLDKYEGGGASSAVQMQGATGSADAPDEPPPETRSEQRGQVLARLLEEWRAGGLLDPPARPADVAEFPPIAPPRTGAIRASTGQAVLAGAAPALVPGTAPEPGPAPRPARPPLRVIPGGKGAPAPTPKGLPLLSPALTGIAVFLVVMLWPSETAPPWMDEISPITGGPYGSADEYDWTKRLSPKQVDYLRRLTRERGRGPVAAKPEPGAGGHVEPLPAPTSRPVPILDGERKQDEKLPDVNFYHGTDKTTATRMAGGEPITASGRGEFGGGFYTFLIQTAAAEAAEVYTRRRNGFMEWGVVDFTVPAAVLAEFFAASSIAALLQGKLSRILVFPDKTTPVAVRFPPELGGADFTLTWTEFVERNAKLGKNVSWPYDLIIGPLKGKLRSQKAGVDQWVFGDDGVMVFNVPTVGRRMVSSGRL
jgi:hypothetical protein